jgi:hypothetical protein
MSRLSAEDILVAFKEADELLRRYKEVISPAIAELARLKGEVNNLSYSGDLGCWEEGIDTVCLHIKGEERPSFDSPGTRATYEWEHLWRDRLTAEGITNIHLQGHY